ncbi:hypothetical protein QL285_065133 [Trifolium repens]|nr:hypothetical protein QL285_065133 [Trifolium repens]
MDFLKFSHIDIVSVSYKSFIDSKQTEISIAEIVTISKIVFFAFNLRLCSKSKVLFDRTMLGIALKMANCEGHVNM